MDLLSAAIAMRRVNLSTPFAEQPRVSNHYMHAVRQVCYYDMS